MAVNFLLHVFEKNQIGRFDVKAVNFRCIKCSSVREARLMDYVASGFWPGDCISLKYFFSKDLFIDWFHDQHLSIGKSQNKFIQRLQNVSNEFGRVPIIHLNHIYI